MGVISDAAVSSGNIMERIARLERRLDAQTHARRLEASSIGAGGLRVKGGVFHAQDAQGEDMFRVGGDPGELFMREDLVEALVQLVAVRIFADRVHTAVVPDRETTSSGQFTDLDTVGPTVSDVQVTTGTAIAFVCAGTFGLSFLDKTPRVAGGTVGVAVSGSTVRAPSATTSLISQVNLSGDTSLEINTSLINRSSAVHVFTGLNPGLHTFNCKYKCALDLDAEIDFYDRELVVIAF